MAQWCVFTGQPLASWLRLSRSARVEFWRTAERVYKAQAEAGRAKRRR